jgi:lipopolysaccharide transport system ATP-binding protein
LIAEKGNNTLEVTKLDSGKTQTTSGTGEAKIEEITLFNSKGNIAEVVGVGEKVELRIKVKVYENIESLVLGYGIKDRLGQVMFGTNTSHTKQVINNPKNGNEYLFTIKFVANLGEGGYSFVLALHDKETHLTANYQWRDLALVFNVVNIDKIDFEGSGWLETKIEVNSS